MFCHQCGRKILGEAVFCSECGSKLEIVMEQKEDTKNHYKSFALEKKSDKDLNGIGGWLTFLGLGIMVTPIFLLVMILTSIGDSYAYEIILNLLLIICYSYVFYLLVKRRKDFINYCTGLLILNPVVVALFYLLTKSKFNEYPVPQEMIDILSSLQGDIFSAAASGLVWILYLRFSKRVKLTFIK